MQLTKHTDLSLRALIYLSLQPETSATISAIAKKIRVSRNHLVKVVHRLGGLGYVTTCRGRGGGVTLAKPAAEIRVDEVVRDFEPTLEVINCLANQCPLIPACRLKKALHRASEAFMEVLATYTIADLSQNKTQLLKLLA